jgi:pimeloyl-ACP methyl ester carboxylesterase
LIGRLLRIVLLVEVAGAAAFAVWFAIGLDLPVPLAAGVGVAVPLGLHVAILTVNFGLAWSGRGDRAAAPPAEHRGAVDDAPARWVLAWAREIPDSLRTFQFAQPLLDRRPFRIDPPIDGRIGRVPPMPVLLLHGYFCNRGLWRTLARRLGSRGHPLEAIDLEPPFGAIDAYTPAIARAVDRLRARTGAARVALVCHSMGGLAARAYLRDYGDAAVCAVVTLGTPHVGTRHADLGHGRNAAQMRRDSDWLKTLARTEPPARRALFTVILSWQDNIVTEQAAQTLPGARTIAFGGLGHMSLAYDRRVAEVVLAALDTAAAHRV